MATYHCSVKTGGKGRGAKHADYISGRDDRDRRDIEAQGHGNMPAWAGHSPRLFWQAADEYEREKGAVYRELEVALPRELSPEERLGLVQEIIKRTCGSAHAYEWAIHCPKAAIEGGEQPHLHLMYSERVQDGIDRDPAQYFRRHNAKAPERGGCKKDSAGTKTRLFETRQMVAEVTNRHLERAGMDGRVDHRSLWERGINREPERHIGPWRDRLTPEVVAALLEQRAAVREAEAAAAAVSGLDLSGSIRDALAAREVPKPAPDPLRLFRDRVREAERGGDAVEAAVARGELDAATALVAQGEPPAHHVNQIVEAGRAAGLAYMRGGRPPDEPRREPEPPAVDVAAGLAAFRAEFERHEAVEAGKAAWMEQYHRDRAAQERQEQERQEQERRAAEIERQRQEADERERRRTRQRKGQDYDGGPGL